MMPTFTSADEEDSFQTQNKQKMRGPYRKYTCQEKQQAVERVSNKLYRFKMGKT